MEPRWSRDAAEIPQSGANLPGPFPDPSRTLPGPFPDPSRTLPGPFPDPSRTLPGLLLQAAAERAEAERRRAAAEASHRREVGELRGRYEAELSACAQAAAEARRQEAQQLASLDLTVGQPPPSSPRRLGYGGRADAEADDENAARCSRDTAEMRPGCGRER